MLTIEFINEPTWGLTNQRARSGFLDIGHVLAGNSYRAFYSLVWLCSGNDVDSTLASILSWRRHQLWRRQLFSRLLRRRYSPCVWVYLAPEPHGLWKKSDLSLLGWCSFTCVWAFLDIGHVDVYLVTEIHPNVDILSTHQYEKLYNDGRCISCHWHPP